MVRLSAVALVVLASTAGVLGDLVTASGSASGSGSASLSLSGSATLTGSGTYYTWVGWPTSAWQGISLNFGTINPGIGSGPTGIGSSPTGSLTVSLDPTDAPQYDAFTRLEHGSLNALNVDIKDGASYGLGTFGGWELGAYRSDNGQWVTTLGLSQFSLALSALGFNMTGGPTGSLTSYYSDPPSNAMVVAGYSIAPYGNLSATLGTATLTTSIYNGGWVGLGSYGIGGGSASMAQSLSGTMTMTELAGPYPRDVAIHIAADTTAGVSISFGNSGPGWSYSSYSGGTNPYFVVNVNTGVSGVATVNSAHVDLYSTLVDVIPEPMTLAVFGLGGALLTLARRRSR